MFDRIKIKEVRHQSLRHSPSFVLLDSRQIRKTLLAWPDGPQSAIKVERNTTSKPGRGFHHACGDIRPEKKWLVYPGIDAYPLHDGIEVLPLHMVMGALIARQANGG